MIKRLISLVISFCLIFEQSGFAQVVPQLPVPAYLQGLQTADKFRPMHLRSLAYDAGLTKFSLLLDQGDAAKPNGEMVASATRKVMEYFQIGLRLPNSCFWVNLRPDTADRIIDSDLERTELGKVFLEADVQLKKDLARFTSPDTPAGKEYWNKLYTKAETLFGQEDVIIPSMVRPWIMPGEIIIKQHGDSAYVYKATMKVMLEQDYIAGMQQQTVEKLATMKTASDNRVKELNDYSAGLIREKILPQLNREVNASKRYAGLRQAFYSLVLAQWFKAHVKNSTVSQELRAVIDSRDLTGLRSKQAVNTQAYYRQYRKSFEHGEYSKEETVATKHGFVIRQYTSGGVLGMPQEGTIKMLADTDMFAADPVGKGIKYDPVTGAVTVNFAGVIDGNAGPESILKDGGMPSGGELSKKQTREAEKKQKILELRSRRHALIRLKKNSRSAIGFVKGYYTAKGGGFTEVSYIDAAAVIDAIIESLNRRYSMAKIARDVSAKEKAMSAVVAGGLLFISAGIGAAAADFIMDSYTSELALIDHLLAQFSDSSVPADTAGVSFSALGVEEKNMPVQTGGFSSFDRLLALFGVARGAADKTQDIMKDPGNIAIGSGVTFGDARKIPASKGVPLEDARKGNKWASYAVNLGDIDISAAEKCYLTIEATGGETVILRLIDDLSKATQESNTYRLTLKPGRNDYEIDLKAFQSDLTHSKQFAVNFGERFFSETINKDPVKMTIISARFGSGTAQASSPPAKTVTAVSTAMPVVTAVPTVVPTVVKTPVPVQTAQQPAEQTVAAVSNAVGQNAMLAQAVGFVATTKNPESKIIRSFSPTPEELETIGNKIEKRILRDGLVIYDGALGQIAFGLTGNMAEADYLTNMYWTDEHPLGFHTMIGGYQGENTAQPFKYDKNNPQLINPKQGERGMGFRIVSTAPYIVDGVSWQDWRPVSGDNMWGRVIGPLQIYYLKYGNTLKADAPELLLAQECARAVMILQADNGGIRMAPIGTWSQADDGKPFSEQTWMYDEISSENCISAYAGFRMLYEITGDRKYKNAMDRLEGFFKAAYDPSTGTMAQGMHFNGREWVKNTVFATDCQTWFGLAMGVEKTDQMLGAGAAIKLWESVKRHAGVYKNGKLIGFDFTDYRVLGREPTVSVEWSMGAVMFAQALKRAYPDQAAAIQNDIDSVQAYTETLKETRNGITGYAYSDKHVPTGHGWIAAGRILSVASTVWKALVDADFNPFFMGGKMPGSIKSGTDTAAVPQEVPTEAIPVPQATPTKATPGFTAGLAAAAGVAGMLATYARRKQVDPGKDEAKYSGQKDGGLPVGGIDMRQMPVIVQPAILGRVSTADPVPLVQLDAQWREILARIKTGVVPAKQLCRYLAACSTNAAAAMQRRQAEEYLAWVLRMEEDAAVVTSVEMKAAIIGG